MLDKGKISNSQMEFMMVPTIIATGILSLPSMVGKFARHDLWMTPVLGAVVGFITVFVAWKLHQLYPKSTPIQYSQEILGKTLGKLLSLFLVLFYIHNTSLIVRQYSDFITSNVMLETPGIVFSITITFVASLAVRGGIEVLARSSVICTALYMSTSVSLLLLIKDVDIGNLLPFLENGPIPVIKGGIIYNAWFSEFFLLAFILPFINSQKNTLKSGMKSTLFVMLFLLFVNFFVLTILGASANNQFYPVYSIIRVISIFDFFENFEVLITASWILGNFVKTSVFFYVSSLGFAQLLRLSDYRFIVFPLGIIIILISYWDIPNVVAVIDYMVKIQPFYFITVQTALPLFLLLIALTRKRRSEQE